MKFLIVAAFIVVSSLHVFANDAQNIQVDEAEAKAHLVHDSTGYHIVSADGLKEVTLYEYFREPIPISAGLKQTENTCVPDQELAQCQMTLGIAPYQFLFVWTKNPDSKLIGTLANNVVDGLGEAKFVSYLSHYHAVKLPQFKSMFQPETIRCDNYAWTENMTKDDSGNLKVSSWSVESMDENLESKVNENMSISTIFGMTFHVNSAKELEMLGSRADYTKDNFNVFPPTVSQQILSLNYLSTKNEVCQVTFEVDSAQAIRMIRNPYFVETDMKKIRPLMSPILLAYPLLVNFVTNYIFFLSEEKK
ncbi:MAG TPA: hypothetical protein VN132_02010 [Bdellovibrio sp.]|nr:hypothetical protein [Bdellovibrio sp.]